jgi:hypothetical protein
MNILIYSIGIREREIITKQFHYLGIAVTNDTQHIYAIASDTNIKVFVNANLEHEWPIESDFLPSSIILSKSERLLYIGMTHGIIRVYNLPLVTGAYIDLPAHTSHIRQLLISDDDQYLISIAESAYILVFRQTNDVWHSMVNEYDFSSTSMIDIDKNLVQPSTRSTKPFDYILVTRSEFDDYQRKINEMQARIKYEHVYVFDIVTIHFIFLFLVNSKSKVI